MCKMWNIFVYSYFGTISFSLFRAYLRRCLRRLVKCSPVSSVYPLHWTSPQQPTDDLTHTYPVMLISSSRWPHTYLHRNAVRHLQMTSHVPTPWCCSGPADYITRTYPMMQSSASQWHHTYLSRDTVRHQQMKSHCAYFPVKAHELIWPRQWWFEICNRKLDKWRDWEERMTIDGEDGSGLLLGIFPTVVTVIGLKTSLRLYQTNPHRPKLFSLPLQIKKAKK